MQAERNTQSTVSQNSKRRFKKNNSEYEQEIQPQPEQCDEMERYSPSGNWIDIDISTHRNTKYEKTMWLVS